LATIFPEIICQIYDCYLNDFKKAQRIQKVILKTIRLADSITFPNGYKLLQKASGMEVGCFFDNQDCLYKDHFDRVYEKMIQEIQNLLKIEDAYERA